MVGAFLSLGVLGTAAFVALAGCAPAPDRAGANPAATQADTSFLRTRGSHAWSFPRDHGAHPAYATEWWYVTGIVRTLEGRAFGYELTFFRVGLAGPRLERGTSDSLSPWRARDLLMAHAAVTDVEAGRFLVEQRLERAAHGWAGADTAGLDVWIGDWRAAAPTGGSEPFELALRVPVESTRGSLGLDLHLATSRPPVLHGPGGLSVKDAGAEPHASWYASLPRLDTRGTLTVGGRRHAVSGVSWMDHEFFSGTLAPSQTGWDWFSCRLADGRDLLVFRLRRADGSTDFAGGTVTSPDGASSRPLRMAGSEFEPLATWKSPRTKATYPVAWRVRLPEEGLELRSRTPVESQEVVAAAGPGFSYWEGMVELAGRDSSGDLRGEGYVEMTGYAAPLRLP